MFHRPAQPGRFCAINAYQLVRSIHFVTLGFQTAERQSAQEQCPCSSGPPDTCTTSAISWSPKHILGMLDSTMLCSLSSLAGWVMVTLLA